MYVFSRITAIPKPCGEPVESIGLAVRSSPSLGAATRTSLLLCGSVIP